MVSGLTGLLADQATDADMCRAVIDPNRRTHFLADEITHTRGGTRWADGRPFFSGMSTLLPPNSPACMPQQGDWHWGIWTPSSRHTATAQFVLADGSVHSFGQDMERSIFQALGTKAGRELISLEDFEN